MNKCRRCLCAFDYDHYAWTVSPQANRRRYSDPVASAYVGAEIDSGLIYSVVRPPGYRGALPSAADATATLAAPVVEICPVCHAVLPDGWRQSHAICLAIAGIQATGKSNYAYLAVLIKHAQLLCEELGVSMDPLTSANPEAYLMNHERTLYESRGFSPSTPTLHSRAPQHREPLIFAMGVRDGIRRFMVIRDIACEELEFGDMQAPRFRCFANADAVFSMFDRRRVRGIRDRLPKLLPSQSF